MSNILSFHLKKEIITLGRIGGQYAKPRSYNYEVIADGSDFIYIESIPVYRGDIINSHSPHERQPDPERMLQAYEKSKYTM